jgi:hypothetical protein
MASISWNPRSFCFAIFLFHFSVRISRTSLRASWWHLVRGKDDRAEARPCMNLHGMYKWFSVVPQGLIVFFLFFPFWWFSEPFLGEFLMDVLRPFSLAFGGGCMHEPFMVLFPLIPLQNLWVKGLNFGVFLTLGLEASLVEILRFLSF